MVGTVESRSARWGVAPGTPSDDGALAPIASRARRVAANAAVQARVAARRAGETRTRTRTILASGAALAALGLGCEALALATLAAPNLLPADVGTAAAAAALLCGSAPAALFAFVAGGWLIGGETPLAAAAARASTFATFGGSFAGAVAGLDGVASRGVVAAVEDLIAALESEARAIGQSARQADGGTTRARRHERIVPHHRKAVVKTADGRNLVGTIADVSLSGVAFTAPLPRVAVGDAVTVGQRPAVAARLWEKGIAFQFRTELDPSTFDESIVL